MGLFSFAKQGRALWLFVFLCIGASGIGCAQRDSAKSQVVAQTAVSGGTTMVDLSAAESSASSAQNEGTLRNAEMGVASGLPGLLGYALTAVIAAVGWILFFYQRKNIKPDAAKKTEGELEAKQQFVEKEQERRAKTDYECYQEALKEELGTISLLGTHALENIPVSLTSVFVSLRLSDTWRSETRFYPDTCHAPQTEGSVRSPEEVMRLVFEKNRLLLVIGDPGSGKTTLIKYYALSCFENAHYKKLGFKKPVHVFYIPLRELTMTGTDYASLPKCLSVWAGKHSMDIPETFFSDWLHKQTTLVLLDGLDEISDQEQRVKACAWIDRLVVGFKKSRFVVTSRYTGYRKGDGIELKSQHTRADIMDFTDKQQSEFLGKWFLAAYMSELLPAGKNQQEWESNQQRKADEKTVAIIAFLNKEENKSLQLLAAVPMLLQIMAILWKERQYLPETRVELYNAAVNYILDYRDRQRELYPLLSAEDARRVLAPLSLWMQEELEKDEAEKAEVQQKMQIELDTLNKSVTAPDFCKNLVDRAGLLVDYGDKEYRFRHKSFREYLAGVQLEKKMHRTLGELDALIGHFGDDWWEEPLRFFIGQVDAEIFDAFMERLFDSSLSEELTQKQQDLLITLIQEAPQKKISALQKKLLHPQTSPNQQRYLLECMKTIGKPEAFDTVRKFTEAALAKDTGILRRATEISENKESPVKGLRGGVGAERLADVVVDTQGAQYILIKGGSFTYSITKTLEPMPDLYVAKFTVTNALYRQFISYLGSRESASAKVVPVELYVQALRAKAAPVEGFADYLQTEMSLAKLFASNYDADKRFNKNDQPVVGVTWYASRAYCLWLSLLESNGRDTDIYRLPSEKEWEYAAAGSERRQYPWGNSEPTKTLANYNEHEGATTPVGRYPDGVTPEGLYDMAGNVWEWMNNKYEENTSARAVRGGSWYNNPDSLRCSARYLNLPALRYDLIGFRVVRPSPSS
ncbi:MAG: NACHT domain-containing protein [Chlorobium sp.]|nr:MAG: NACHT domain-containing protein [Chlorobium sp.]